MRLQYRLRRLVLRVRSRRPDPIPLEEGSHWESASALTVESCCAAFDAVRPYTLGITRAIGSRRTAGRAAARHGMRGYLVDLDTGERRPTSDRVAELLDSLGPRAERLGGGDELDALRPLLAGNGADRQRCVAGRAGVRRRSRPLARGQDGTVRES
jgi:hypothetical protein